MFCKFIAYVCMPVHHVYTVSSCRGQRKIFGSPGTRGTDSCESPSVGAENQSWVFSKRSQGS